MSVTIATKETVLYDEFTIKDRFLYADTECNVWKLILFTIIFQKSFSNKTIIAMNLHQTLEIEVPKSVLSVRVSWFKDILWTNYVYTYYFHIIQKSYFSLFGQSSVLNVANKTKMFKFQIRKDYPATTFLFSIILVSQETSSWSYTIDTVYPAQCKPDTVNWLQMNFDLMSDRCLM